LQSYQWFVFYILKGQPIEYIEADDSNKKWLNEFKAKPFSVPGKLENVDGNKAVQLFVRNW